MSRTPLTRAALLSTLLLGGCASMQPDQAGMMSESQGKTSCGSFFVYKMCLTDTLGDQRVDYMYFADTDEIFMYRPGATLPTDKSVHRCAMAMEDKVVTHSSELLYGDELSLLQEMDVKRKLLLSYMSAKDGVDGCYGGDSRTGLQAEGSEADFVSDDYDWGEE